MTNVNPKFALTAVLGLALGLVLSSVRADVKVQTLTHFGGIAGMGASNISDTSYLQGHKKRSESNLQFTGAVFGTVQKLMSHGDKGGNSVTIYRVDENRKFVLDTANKTYRESPIYSPPPPSQAVKTSPSSSNSGQPKENDVRVVKSEFNVQDTGKKQTINGFQTHEYLVTWNVETENIKTHEHGRSLLTTELWNSEDARFIAARKEQAAYGQAYAQLLHMPMTTDMTKQYGLLQMRYLTHKDIKPFADKLSRIKGFPVVTDVKWEAGCTANCAHSDQPPPQQEQSSGSSGGLGSLLGGLLNKNSAQNIQSDQQPKSTDGLSTIFQSHTEVQSIDTGSQPASLFEVPAGYTKD
ncbi:MAG TPA: hypothetical protein VNF46_03295 [Gammaproteobacteria bacterium]|nr:hypothetical protein [Gammaproteobacteria bacterium]